MPHTQNSLEYKILQFLNDRFEDYDIEESAIRTFLSEFPQNEFTDGLKKLREIGYISNKSSPDHPKGITITPDGMKRYNQMKEHIDTLKNISALNANSARVEKNTKVIDKVKVYGLIVAVFGLFIGGLQVYFMWEQNSIAKQELEISKQKQHQPAQVEEPSQIIE